MSLSSTLKYAAASTRPMIAEVVGEAGGVSLAAFVGVRLGLASTGKIKVNTMKQENRKEKDE
jgi:hypothetical protein